VGRGKEAQCDWGVELVAAGAFIKLQAIYLLSDIVNGLMALPNLVALLGLSGVVVAETRLYLRHMKQ